MPSALLLAVLLVGLVVLGAPAVGIAPVAAQAAEVQEDEVPASDAPAADPPAHDHVTWGISPSGPDARDERSVIEHVVDPGAAIVDHVVVDNRSDRPIAVDLYAADARPANGEFDVQAADEPSVGIGAWAELGRDRVEVPAQGHVIVEVVVRVPADAEPGDHAGGIMASRRSIGGGDDVGIETERRVGSRVHLRVAGPIRPSLEVADLVSSYSQSGNPAGSGELTVTYRIENTGNVRLGGEVEVVVAGPFGMGRRSVYGPPVSDLLPGHGADHQITVDARPLGRLEVAVEVTPTVSIDQPLGDAVGSDRATTSTWAVPIAALVLVSTALTWVAVRRTVRRRRGRRLLRAATA